MRILQYIKKAPRKGLLYKKYGHTRIDAYTYVAYVGNVDDRLSTFGFYTYIGGNLVTWKSKKQNVVPRSSCKAEYGAMAHTICEIL